MHTKSITLKNANAFITKFHRHHKPTRGWKFGTSLVHNNKIIGVVIVGRPVARIYDDGDTLEVLRLCTDGTKNACSVLYGVARRVAFELGYKRIITYILTTENGTSLKASGWTMTGIVKGRSWSTPTRPRIDKHPTIDKYRWESYNPIFLI